MSRLLLGPNPGGREPVTPEGLRVEAAAEPAPERAAPARRIRQPRTSAVYTWALVTFVVLEFARPPVVSGLKLQLLITFVLPILLGFSRLRWWHPLMTVWSLLFALTVIQVPIASNNYSAYMFARASYAGVAIALSIAWALQRRAALEKGLLAWVFSLAYVALFGITHGGRGPSGFMGDENDMALACCTAIPFAFFGFEQMKGWKKIVAGGLMVAFVVAIVVSFSRGGFVGLAAVGLYCFWWSRHKMRNVAIGIAAVILMLALAPQSYIDEIKTIQDTEEGTAESRRFLWHAAVNMWLDHPVIGVGGGGSNFLVGKYQPRDPRFDHPSYRLRNWSGQAVHSLYFQLLAELGTVGVILYGSMVYLHFRLLSRLRKEVTRRTARGDPLRRWTELCAGSLAGAMMGFLVPATFVSVLQYPYVWYLSAFALALDRVVRFELDARPARRRAARPARSTAAVPRATPA